MAQSSDQSDDNQDKIELTKLDTFLPSASKTEGESKNTLKESKYTMLSKVGEGAMGEILLAIDQDLRRKVAYKKVHAQMATNRKVMSRFFTEAQITAQLDHPNIVPIYSLEVTPDGDIGYSMKLIKGHTLKDLIIEARQQLDSDSKTDEHHSLNALLDHFLKVCDAMHYSHMKGVIHRDLKPANIMIGPYNEVYVMDWGIAKVITQPDEAVDEEVVKLIQSDPDEPEMERTQLGQVVGTPRYMSPQQAAGKNDQLDGASDQFSLGLILFELVTLKPALTAKNQIELLKKVLKVELEPFTHHQPRVKIPQELQSIIHKATGKKAPQRYASVEDMADDIRRYLRGEAVLAKPDTPQQRLMRWMGRHRELTLGIVLAVFILSASVTIWSMYEQKMAIIQAQENEQKLSRFLLWVGKQSQLIDSQFMGSEALLERMGGSMIQLLEHAQIGKGPVFTSSDFSDPQTAPPDLSESSFYKMPLSVDWNTFKLAPGLKKEEVLPLLKQVSPIRHVYKQIMLKSHSQNSVNISPQKAREMILEKGLPLIWVYTGLKEGVQVSYPGKGGYSPKYDPRERPWYKDSLKERGPQWSKPYIDTGGKGWVLPCTMPLYNSKEEFLGVSGVEMTLDYIKNDFLKLKETPGVINSYLLDDQARIVVSTQDESANFKVGTLINKARELKPYPRQDVVEQILTQRSGYYQFIENKEKRVLAYYQIHSLGWYYLVEARSDELVSGESQH